MIGIRIKQIRKEKGLTQKQLADSLFVSQNTISGWEKGSNTPPLSLLALLEYRYLIKKEWVLTGKGEKELKEPGLSPDEKRIVDMLRKYPKNIQPNILKTFNVLLTNYFEKYIRAPKERRISEIGRLQKIIRLLSIRK